MKTLEIAYCLVKKHSRIKQPDRFSPLLLDAQMPIYWNRKVAEKEARFNDADVIKVVVEPYENLKS